jgi:hypothetical protein
LEPVTQKETEGRCCLKAFHNGAGRMFRGDNDEGEDVRMTISAHRVRSGKNMSLKVRQGV